MGPLKRYFCQDHLICSSILTLAPDNVVLCGKENSGNIAKLSVQLMLLTCLEPEIPQRFFAGSVSGSLVGLPFSLLQLIANCGS